MMVRPPYEHHKRSSYSMGTRSGTPGWSRSFLSSRPVNEQRNIYMCVYMCMYIYIYIYLCICVCMCVYIYIYMDMIYIYIYIYIYTWILIIYIYIYIHKIDSRIDRRSNTGSRDLLPVKTTEKRRPRWQQRHGPKWWRRERQWQCQIRHPHAQSNAPAFAQMT